MNNIFLGNDPLLTNKDYISRLEQELSQQKSLYNKMNEQYAPTDWYGKMEEEFSKLSPQEQMEINNDGEYINAMGVLNAIIATETINMIRNTLNTSERSVGALKSVTEAIYKYKNRKAEENNKAMSEFQEYMQNYSNMTFAEYKQMKNETSRIKE